MPTRNSGRDSPKPSLSLVGASRFQSVRSWTRYREKCLVHRRTYGKTELRIVLDRFDRLSDCTRDAVREAIAVWLDDLRVVITARPDTSGFHSGHTLGHGTTSRDALDGYLTSRQTPPASHQAILDRADGRWLLTRMLAKTGTKPKHGRS